VLFVTGYAENATYRSNFLGPGMDMLTKPFALDVLGAKVRAMLVGWWPGSPAATEISDRRHFPIMFDSGRELVVKTDQRSTSRTGVIAAKAAKQEQNDQNDDKNAQYSTQASTTVVALAVAVETTTAKQQNEYDNNHD
jgi:DNA-binding response OmpR family regulator